MNTSIAPLPTVSAFTPMSSSTAPPAGQAAAVSQPRSTVPAAPSATGNLKKDTSIDTTGYVVVKTIDPTSNEVVAQTPTEAYLRLAHAMAGTLQAETRSGSTSDKVA